ncbi:hypothetical protein [Agriterribacter sp.]|uniref:hypothetical protein n=1 Tax=Agriterribacter sp. TaxID=2821509 RepID=UPI002BAB46DD|nr:hypothetical protein [Agriterribacter sp.]HRO44633.1 hypothetical protein [Agriterribacter sp.]HRQ16070.1 hypothetical protein [Agriterribacter sp.]
MNTAQKQPALLICLVMDLLGYASYALPFLGEFGDVIWAPVSGLIFYRLFGGWKGAMGGIFNFIEELLPGLDFIPSFTVMWIIKFVRKQQQAKSIQPI